MANFLGLPREIRDAVLELVPYLPRKAPPEPLGEDLERRLNPPSTPTPRLCRPFARHDVLFDADPLRNPVLSLLLVNHQLHDETMDMLHRMSREPQYLVLDLLHCESRLSSTWLVVPTLASRYATFHVQFRARDERPGENLWEETTLFSTSLSHLDHVLGLFLKEGLKARHDHGPFIADKLVLDFPPTIQNIPRRDNSPLLERIPPESGRYSDEYISPFMLPPAEHTDLDSACASAEFIHHHVLKHVITELKPASLGCILYANIGSIEIRLDGKALELIDLADLLNRFPFRAFYHPIDPSSYTQRIVMAWKEATVEKRRGAGLPVI
ncbi:hypothetical protein F4778DRAFT_734410 [Xylariomycetidae sp. FL2044]|nr:hypothetical protein F4778DRAFT_734410 [Xylariomycetidae sp. FL2044]